jgi:hypothetical protein
VREIVPEAIEEAIFGAVDVCEPENGGFGEVLHPRTPSPSQKKSFTATNKKRIATAMCLERDGLAGSFRAKVTGARVGGGVHRTDVDESLDAGVVRGLGNRFRRRDVHILIGVVDRFVVAPEQIDDDIGMRHCPARRRIEQTSAKKRAESSEQREQTTMTMRKYRSMVSRLRMSMGTPTIWPRSPTSLRSAADGKRRNPREIEHVNIATMTEELREIEKRTAPGSLIAAIRHQHLRARLPCAPTAPPPPPPQQSARKPRDARATRAR